MTPAGSGCRQDFLKGKKSSIPGAALGQGAEVCPALKFEMTVSEFGVPPLLPRLGARPSSCLTGCDEGT